MLGGAVAAPAAYYVGCPHVCKDHVEDYIPPEFYNSELGRQYIKTVLAGVSHADIARELKEKLPWYYAFFPRRAIQNAVEKDYAAGDSLIARGWVLPKVVVLLCAVAAIQTQETI